MKNWTDTHLAWIQTIRFDEVTIVAELGQLSRFATAPQLMAYSGIDRRPVPVGPSRFDDNPA